MPMFGEGSHGSSAAHGAGLTTFSASRPNEHGMTVSLGEEQHPWRDGDAKERFARYHTLAWRGVPSPGLRVQDEASPARRSGQPRAALRVPLRGPGTEEPAGQDPRAHPGAGSPRSPGRAAAPQPAGGGGTTAPKPPFPQVTPAPLRAAPKSRPPLRSRRRPGSNPGARGRPHTGTPTARAPPSAP